MALITTEKRDKLLTKALRQKEFAQNYKEKRIKSWDLNEELMNPDRALEKITDKDIAGGVQKAYSSADVPLFDLHAFRDTFLSKIKTPMSFKYIRGDIGDDTKAKLMNALKERDAKKGRWLFKDLLGKNDALTYGRAIYFYKASFDGKAYASMLKLIDPKDFLIDPDVGGLCLTDDADSIDNTRYLGWWNVKITRQELQDGKKAGIYYADVVDKLLSSEYATTIETDQEKDKEDRRPVSAKDILADEDVFTFYAWFLRDEQDNLIYMLFDGSGSACIRAEKWADIEPSNMIPVWTWAAYPDPREFWSPSPLDYYRGISIAKQKSINQMLDNAERINDPPKAVNVDAIRNPAQARARKSALIEVEGEMTAQNAMQVVDTPAIDTPLAVYDKLDAISQALTGMTAGLRGDSKEEVVAVYEGNKEEASDRVALMSRSYSEGYHRFGVLYKEGVYQHLRKKEAVEIVGSQGLDIEYIKRTQVRPAKRDYNILVESTNAEAVMNATETRNKIAFLGAYRGAENINQSVIFEEEARLVGYPDDAVSRFLSTTSYDDMRVLSQAEEAFQFVIDGKSVPPYKTINTQYVERINDLWRKHSSELSDEQNANVIAYINVALEQARENAAREATIKASQEADQMSQMSMDQQMAAQQGMRSAGRGALKLQGSPETEDVSSI